jgi:hypothetical protein
MGKAAEAYQDSLKIRTLKDFPLDYARMQNNLGVAYKTLAEVEDRAANCRKAIRACQEALKIRKLNQFPMDYAETQIVLGSAFKALAEVENRADNCKRERGMHTSRRERSQ